MCNVYEGIFRIYLDLNDIWDDMECRAYLQYLCEDCLDICLILDVFS